MENDNAEDAEGCVSAPCSCNVSCYLVCLHMVTFQQNCSNRNKDGTISGPV